MNIKQIFLPLIGALALVGCNKEAVEPTSSNLAQPTSVTLALSLEGTADASEMRAVSFDANQNVPPTTHDQYSDWTTHCFLRNDDGSKKAYAVIHWDARVEGGKVKLKMRGHELNLLPIGSSGAELSPENKPVAGERWSIEGITGGGKLNSERTRVDFAPDADLDKNLQPHQARVPFTFEKTFFTVSASSGERAPQISVHFKPQGSLLNIRVNNKTAQFVQTELRILSNALSNNGYYDYSTGEAQWKFSNIDAPHELISRTIAMVNGVGRNYVLWGMPRLASVGGFSSQAFVAGYEISSEGATIDKPKVRTESFVNGLAYPMGIDLDLSISPLNALVETTKLGANFIAMFKHKDIEGFKDAMTFSDRMDAYSSDIYYNYDQAMVYSDTDKPYYLPTIWELGTIFPAQKTESDNDLYYYYNGQNATGEDILERVQFSKNESPVIVTSRYVGAGEGTKILYALRFTNLSGALDNSKRTAFRYEYVNLGKLKDNITDMWGLKVTTRHLGNDGDDIGYSTEEYWNNVTKNGKDATVIFPAVGRKNEEGFASLGFYWSSTPFEGEELKASRAYFDQDLVFGYYNNTKDREFPILLFKK